MAYKRISKNYVKNQYIKIYKEQTGCVKLTQEEDDFFEKFTKTDALTARIIFFNAVFMFKRFYPKYIIKILINSNIKRVFKTLNAPKKISDISIFFAKDITDKAAIYYCKNDVTCIKNNIDFSLKIKNKFKTLLNFFIRKN
jgi:hypothetical protein